MKRFFSLLAVISLIFLTGLAPVAFAEKVLFASISSQIHEAFGRDILDVFKEASGITVKTHVFSSGKAMERVKNGVSDIAASTIRLSKSDRASGLIEIPICKDALVIITNPDCGVKNVTLQQARRIFSGYIKNWQEIGGADLPILRIIPDQNTGAYNNFKRLVMGPFELVGDLFAAKAFTAVTGVKNMSGSVAFIANGVAIKHNDISVLNIDGVFPADSDYPFHQIFSMVIKSKPSALTKEVIKFLSCDAAVEIMKEHGIKPMLE